MFTNTKTFKGMHNQNFLYAGVPESRNTWILENGQDLRSCGLVPTQVRKSIKLTKFLSPAFYFITPPFASLHGNLCGDGCISQYKVKYGIREMITQRRKKKFRDRKTMVYTNNRPELLEKFKKNIKKLFPLVKFSNSKFNEVRLRAVYVINTFQRYGNYGSWVWEIPYSIFNGKENLKTEWIKSFFDDEATIAGRRILADSVNRKGLSQVSSMLDNLNIENTIKEYKTKARLVVYNLERYHQLIGFDHLLKKEILTKKLN